jgi:hypothetical protein
LLNKVEGILLQKDMNREEKIENGLFYHVYNRGNDKNHIFGDDSDYFAFIEKMK